MDLVFIILSMVLISLLIITWVLNGIKRTKDLNSIFSDLQKMNPNTTAFCLGRDKKFGEKFKNVYLDEKGKAYIKLETFPIASDSKYYTNQNAGHGVIKDARDGFKITGLDLVTFVCPMGFEGPSCQLLPICDGNDDYALKPLTYTQFNTINLYKNTFAKPRTKPTSDGESSDLKDKNSIHHPRIRVRCLTGGNYELQTCPDNKLLDANLRCKPYDICENKLNGYKHKYQINDSVLRQNEYYLCNNNKSEKTVCSGDTVFSDSKGGCINESVCFNKGITQISVDANHYIQCEKDVGKRIQCVEGVLQRKDDNGEIRLSCKVTTCAPSIISFDTGTLKYQYGVLACVNDKPQLKVCDNSQSETPKIYRYKWAEKFECVIRDWPKQIMVDNNCVAPTDEIIKNPVVELRWSDVMSDPHPFNLKTQQYVCDAETTKYRWDYINGVTVPRNNNKDLFIDSGAPCQTKGYNLDELEWGNFKIRKFPESSTLAPIVIGCPVDFKINRENKNENNESNTNTDINRDNNNNNKINLWPVYDETTKTYSNHKFEYQYIERTVILKKTFSSFPPLGFNERATTGPLELIGFKEMPYNFANQYAWFVLSSGKFKSIEYASDSKSEISRVYNCPKILKTDKNSKTFILWKNIKEGEEIKLSTSKITLTRNGVKFENIFEAASYTPLILETDGIRTRFKYGNIVTFMPPSLTFSMP